MIKKIGTSEPILKIKKDSDEDFNKLSKVSINKDNLEENEDGKERQE